LNKEPYGDVELGMPVYATCPGVVVFAGWAQDQFLGNVVITMSIAGIGLYYWRYAHLNEITTELSAVVQPGELIGTIGKGAYDRFAAHLHLDVWNGHTMHPEVWKSSRVAWVDPLQIWKAAGERWEWATR